MKNFYTVLILSYLVISCFGLQPPKAFNVFFEKIRENPLITRGVQTLGGAVIELPDVQTDSFSVYPEADSTIMSITKNDIKFISRKATELDFYGIAELRLSVFSLFNQQLRERFICRSLELMSERKQLGSVCMVVSSCQAKHSVFGPGDWDCYSVKEAQTPSIVGSVECSFHEFCRDDVACELHSQKTRLYVTELAVHAEFRRMGIGKLLLRSVDAWAQSNGFSEIYLHVNDLNEAAVCLYQKEGFSQTSCSHCSSFTNSLGLGSKKYGQRHTLMKKKVSVGMAL